MKNLHSRLLLPILVLLGTSFYSTLLPAEYVIITKDGAKQYKCPDCVCSYTTKKSLYRHRRLAPAACRSLLCTHCDAGFKQAKALAQHNKIVHGQGLEPGEHWCGECRKIFKSEIFFQNHNAVSHNLSTDTSRGNGRAGLAINDELLVDAFNSQLFELYTIGDIPPDEEINNTDIPICWNEDDAEEATLLTKKRCDECFRILKTEKSLKEHKRLTHGPHQPFCCPACSVSFNSSHSLLAHQQARHPLEKDKDGNFICPYPDCGKAVPTLKALRNHDGYVHTRKYASSKRTTGQRRKRRRVVDDDSSNSEDEEAYSESDQSDENDD
jgi:hypothetical protein